MEHLSKLAMEQIELRQIANTDPLTGALTRRGFQRDVEQEFSRASRYQRPAALVFLDIDHFKRVNDEFGHPAGDLVLQAVARACENTLRQSDAFGRLGGEEFGLLLPETGAEDAMQCAERVRQAIEALTISIKPGTDVRITSSLGVSSMTPELATPAMWFAAADVALYQAKRGGRNCVVSADSFAAVATPPAALTDRVGQRLH